jgi:type I restriction enzyme S subunit
MINIVLSLPQNIIEQTKIAKVFIDLSQNIVMLETKLMKLKYQKQGMMQALLTGKIRLI